MHSVNFNGARKIGKPENMTDEQCHPIMALDDTDDDGFHFWETAWAPSETDLQILNAGGTLRVRTLAVGLPPMMLYAVQQPPIYDKNQKTE